MTTPCEACNKSSLSLLLLRPSPIAKSGELVPAGADAVQSVPATTDGLLPTGAITESRFALRLLRAGYVHVYLASPPPGMKNWLVYRVTEEADLLPEKSAHFAHPDQSAVCHKKLHNVAGMKVLDIPQAHKITDIWIAYSANLWNDKLRKENQANPKVMQHIKLAGGSPNTFKPTAAKLKSKVLECALPELRIGTANDHDFKFNSLTEEVASLAQNLVKAAACHPKTAGKELAVVLRDPVGIAAELNTLRLRRKDMIEQYMLQPEIRQPMEVNAVIQHLQKNVISQHDVAEIEEQIKASRVMKMTEFEHRSQCEGWSRDITWQEFTPQEYKTSPYTRGYTQESKIHYPLAGNQHFAQSGNLPNEQRWGHVNKPGVHEDAERTAKYQADKAWAKMQEYFDDDKRKQWQTQFAQDIDTRFNTPLKKEEADWITALKDQQFNDYFALHFDENAGNTPEEALKTGSCSGSNYCREARLACTPESCTESGTAYFASQLDASLTDPQAIMQRAVLANQADLIALLNDDKRSKVSKFMKGLIKEAKFIATDGEKIALPKPLEKKLSWLTNVTLGYSFGIVGALGAVAGDSMAKGLEAASGSKAFADSKALARLAKAQSLLLLQRACEETYQAITNKTQPNIPVLILASFDPDTAAEILKGRGAEPKAKTRRKWQNKGRVTLGILTDSHTQDDLIKKAQAAAAADKATNTSHLSAPELHAREIAQNAHAVLVEEHALNFGKTGGALAGITITVEQLRPLVEKQQARMAKAPQLVADWLAKIGDASKSNTAKGLQAGVLGMDGRLAVGSMLVQVFGIQKGLAAYEKSATPDAQFNARLKLADATQGFLAGVLDLSAAAWTARLKLIDAGAVEGSVAIPFFKGLSYGLGAAGNGLNAWLSFREADRLKKEGNVGLGKSMYFSGLMFVFGGIPLALLSGSFLATAALNRGIIVNEVYKTAIKKIGERMAARVLLLSVPGWGWALTAIAVGVDIYVVVNTPTAVQTWLKGCYFGKPDNPSLTRKSWEEEEAALKKLQEEEQMSPEARAQKKHQENDYPLGVPLAY